MVRKTGFTQTLDNSYQECSQGKILFQLQAACSPRWANITPKRKAGVSVRSETRAIAPTGPPEVRVTRELLLLSRTPPRAAGTAPGTVTGKASPLQIPKTGPGKQGHARRTPPAPLRPSSRLPEHQLSAGHSSRTFPPGPSCSCPWTLGKCSSFTSSAFIPSLSPQSPVCTCVYLSVD